jgi:hypothetical protein
VKTAREGTFGRGWSCVFLPPIRSEEFPRSVNAYYGFNNATRPRYAGPKRGALVLGDGSTVALDLTCYADTTKVRANPSVGLALLTPANGEWSVEIKATTGTLAGRSFRGSAPQPRRAVSLAFGAQRTAQQEDGVRTNPVLHLERELAHHDWYSYMNDDHSVWAGGEAHGRLLSALATQVSPEATRFLWAKYAPAGFNYPV